jgi:hypothetical protein
MRALLALVACVSLSGCVPIARSMPLGASMPPRPPECDVAFVRDVKPDEARERWEEIGVVSVIGEGGAILGLDELFAPSKAHEAAREQACALGADIVVPVGLMWPGIELGAFRERPADHAPDASE